MSFIAESLRRRGERGSHRPPDQVVAAAYQEIGRGGQKSASPSTIASQAQPRHLTALPDIEKGSHVPERGLARRTRSRVLASATAILALALIGLVVAQNPSDKDGIVAANGVMSPPTAPRSEMPSEESASLDKLLPSQEISTVDVLRLEGGYLLQAAWGTELCVSLRHGNAGGSTCAAPEYLTSTLVGATAELGDWPGYFISGVVGPDATHVRASFGGNARRSVPVVSSDLFGDVQFFVISIAPDEHVEALDILTRDGSERSLMDNQRLAGMIGAIEDAIG